MAEEFKIPEELAKKLTPAEREAIASGQVSLEDLQPKKKKKEKPLSGEAVTRLKAGEHVDVGDLLEDLAHTTPEPDQTTVGTEMPMPEDTEDAPAEAPAPVKEEDTRAVTHCPRCNWDLGVKEIEITETDKRDFLRYVLGAASFEKTYSLYGGLAEVTFRSKGPAEQDVVLKQVDIDHAKERWNDFTGMTFLQQRYQAAVMFKSLKFTKISKDTELTVIDNHTLKDLMSKPELVKELKNKLVENPQADDWVDDKDTPVRVMHAVLVASIPPPIYSVMFQLSLDFTALVDLLVWRANDPGFWSAAAKSI